MRAFFSYTWSKMASCCLPSTNVSNARDNFLVNLTAFSACNYKLHSFLFIPSTMLGNTLFTNYISLSASQDFPPTFSSFRLPIHKLKVSGRLNLKDTQLCNQCDWLFRSLSPPRSSVNEFWCGQQNLCLGTVSCKLKTKVMLVWPLCSPNLHHEYDNESPVCKLCLTWVVWPLNLELWQNM